MPESPLRPDYPAGRAVALLPSPFACSWTTRAGTSAWMHVVGELDIATTPTLERTLGEPDSQTQLVVLDLRELEFVDGSGVQAILRASVDARRIGRRLLVLHDRAQIDRVFALTGCAGHVEHGRGGGQPAALRTCRPPDTAG